MTNLDTLIAAAREKGTDDEFLEWVRKQPSCITGHHSRWRSDIGEWKNPACHVRRVSNGSGTAIKPPYSAVAMTDDEHDLQTVKGEQACLKRYHPTKREWTVEEAKGFFDQQRIETLERWILS